MTPETENVIRSVAAMDPDIKPEALEKAIRALRGEPEPDGIVTHVVRRKEALKILGVHRRTLDYYLAHGYLTRVRGAGVRAIGITRESLNHYHPTAKIF